MDFNDRFFDDLGTSAAVTGLVKAKADRIAARARSTAPVASGAYQTGIHVETKRAAHRNVAVVVATDEKSLLVEAQTGNLVRALRADRGS